MDRAQMVAAVNASRSRAFRDEVDHHCSGIDDREYAYDEVSALFDIERRAEDERDRALLREARRLLIAIGYYRVMPAEEQAQVTVSSGTVWAFKQAGVAYTFDDPIEHWQWPPEDAR